ncbi:UNVERIFIED_CONTAM: hypothetical protein K2H54_023289 [Gekko kuhli]
MKLQALAAVLLVFLICPNINGQLVRNAVVVSIANLLYTEKPTLIPICVNSQANISWFIKQGGLWFMVGQERTRNEEGPRQRGGGGGPWVEAANAPALRPTAAYAEAQPQVLLDAAGCQPDMFDEWQWAHTVEGGKQKGLPTGSLVKKSMRSDWKPSGHQCTSSELSTCHCTVAPQGAAVVAAEAPGKAARQVRGQLPPACRWSLRVARPLCPFGGCPSPFLISGT